MIYASLLASLLALIIYMLVVIKKSGIPASISESYYRIEHRKWFTFVMLIIAFCIIPVSYEASTPASRFLMFLAAAGLIIIAVAPNFAYGEKSEFIAHYTGAAMLLLFSQIWVYINFKYILLLWILFAGYIVYGLFRNKEAVFYESLKSLKPIFWAEVTLILTTYITIFVRL